MFRNLRFFRLDGAWPDSEDGLSKCLEAAGFEPCGPLTERSSGWVTVTPDDSGLLARRVNGADLIRMRSQSRVMPAAAVNEELEARIADFQQRMQEAPSPREKRRLKAEARDELMPKALLKSDRIWGYFDLKEKVLGIDTALDSVAERFIRRLQASVDGMNIRPLQYMRPVEEFLTAIFFEDAPRQFALGRECKMQDLGDAKSVVRWTGFDLAEKSIRDHVANGMRLTHLCVIYDNMASFVIDENGAISKLRFIGLDDDDAGHEDALARQDAEFVLLTGCLRNLLGDLKKALGGFA